MKLGVILRHRFLGYAMAAVMVISAGAGALVLGTRSGQTGSASAAVPATARPGEFGATPEALLNRALNEVSHKRIDSAITEIDKAITAYPNFRLAHLIKGDLLLARARPLTTIGNAPGAPRELLEDLREEARARLARYNQQRPVELVPRYLLQMQPDQQQAFIVDTARSTLYVFENRNGEPRYVADYYVSIGKKGYDKFREGDNKTPLGVYHVTGMLTRDKLNVAYGKLAEQYGAGALPISYPNDFDRREGRNGFGIWLHGVPFDTYSRPPRASNGCVALTNEDFETIARTAQIGVTPVIIANGVDWVAPGEGRALRAELTQRLENWRRDWESLDTEKYLAYYAPSFQSGKLDRAQWADQKRNVNAGKEWVKLKLDKVSVFLYPGRSDLAVVSFDQDYASSNLTNQMRKRQYWIREGGSWRILHEGAA